MVGESGRDWLLEVGEILWRTFAFAARERRGHGEFDDLTWTAVGQESLDDVGRSAPAWGPCFLCKSSTFAKFIGDADGFRRDERFRRVRGRSLRLRAMLFCLGPFGS